MPSFNTVVSNDLEEVHMIAGDNKDFTYVVYDENNNLVNLTSASPVVSIFKYGNPGTVFCVLTGVVTPLPTVGEFTVNFPSSSSIDLSGVYQQQIRIIDHLNMVHIPSQGKIIIFPSPNVGTSTFIHGSFPPAPALP